MFRIPLLAALLGLMTVWSPAAQATEGFASGGDLLGWCRNMETDDLHWGLCVGSITAAHDTVMTYQAAGVAENLVCTTMSTTRGDVVMAVVEYLEKHPEEWDHAQGDVILSALIEHFPCPGI